MAYTINRTDGSIIATVADGQIDQGSTDLTLIGKNFSGFGDYLNENFVKLLENFSGQAQPTQPLSGQLWFDTSENRIKVYSGTEWKAVGTSALAISRPLDISTGDFWFNTSDSQLFFFDGLRDYLIGPLYTSSQNLSGFRVESLEDIDRRSRVVTGVYNNNRLLGYWSSQDFTLRNPVPDFNTVNENGNVISQLAVRQGFNPASNDYKWRGTADSSSRLGNYDASAYVVKTLPNVLTQTLTVQNNDGILFGSGPQGRLSIESFRDVSLRNTSSDGKILLRATRGSNLVNYINIIPQSTSTDLIEIAPANPTSLTTVGGSLRVTGDLTVLGNFVSVEVATLRVEDINIELGTTSSGSGVTDAQAYGGGVILKGTTNHSILWNTAETATAADQDWDFSENIDIPANRSYKIGGVPVIRPSGSSIELTSAVTSAPGLTSFGSQISITADNITIDDNRISNNGRTTPYVNGDPANPTNIVIEPLGDVEFIGSPKLIGVSTTSENLIDQTSESSALLSSTELSEATSKKYVTNLVRTRSVPLTLDISGAPGPITGPGRETKLTNSEIITLVTQICPPDEYDEGTVARISTIRYYLEDELAFDISTGSVTPLYDVTGAETPSGTPGAYAVVREISATTTIPAIPSPRIYARRGYMELDVTTISGSLAWKVKTALVENASPYALYSTFFATRTE